jgi:hypothetical protein
MTDLEQPDPLLMFEPYEPLRWIVECRNPGPPNSFEPIAAFNVGIVASRYAEGCRKSNPRNLYRVRVREGDRLRAYEGTS